MTAIVPFCVVRHGTQRVVQRFGVISRVLMPGVNWVTPMVDTFVAVDWSFSNAGSRVVGVDIPTNTLSFDPTELTCTTRDQLAVDIDLLVEFRVDNVAKAVTQSSNLFASIESVVLSAVYEIVRSLNLADVSPRVVQTAITDAVAQTSSDYGFKLVRVFVERIGIPDAISLATESVEAQRRQKVAELDKLQQESEIKLSQQRLKLMLTEAAAVEEQLVVTNNAKKRKAETQAEVEAEELRLAHELRRLRALQDVENEAFKKRLVAIAESPLSDSASRLRFCAATPSPHCPKIRVPKSFSHRRRRCENNTCIWSTGRQPRHHRRRVHNNGRSHSM
jgi:regulator of protease activity HflC (stomatin/prohibitin superfamily)